MKEPRDMMKIGPKLGAFLTSIKPIEVAFENRAICRSLKLGQLNLVMGG